MALIIEGGISTSLMEVGVGEAVAAEVTVKPAATLLPGMTVVGHYRASQRVTINNSMAAANQSVGRLVHLRSRAGGIMVIPTRFRVVWTQTGNHTAQVSQQLGLVKAYTSDDVTESGATLITPVAKDVPGSPGASSPRNRAALWYASGSGANGMTGMTPLPVFEGNASTPTHYLCRMEMVMQATQPDGTTGLPPRTEVDMLDDVNGTYPLVLAAGESLMLMFVGPTAGLAASSSFVFDVCWFEATAF